MKHKWGLEGVEFASEKRDYSWAFTGTQQFQCRAGRNPGGGPLHGPQGPQRLNSHLWFVARSRAMQGGGP